MFFNLRVYFCIFFVSLSLCFSGVFCKAEEEKSSLDSNEIVDHRYFLLQLFQKYGERGVIKFEGFEHLLSNLGLGGLEIAEDHGVELHKPDDQDQFKDLHDTLGLHNAQHEHLIHERSIETPSPFDDEILIAEHNFGELPNPKEIRKKLGHKCLSPKQMLVAYGVPPVHNSVISPLTFLHICPAIIYQLDSKECVHNSPVSFEKKEDYATKWLSAFVSIFIISVAGLLGVAVVPLIHKSIFAHLINFLVALAIGTLTGDAFLHLIPHALKRDHDESETSVVLRASAIFLAAFSFFVLEKIIHGTQNMKKPTEEEMKMQQQITGEEEYSAVKSSDSVDDRLSEMGCNENGGRSSKREAVAWMIITSDGIHNFTDGLAIGAAFSADFVAGIATSVAVFTHELPHELGDFAVLLKSGVSVQRALLYNILSSVLSIAGMIVGVWLGDLNEASSWIYAGTAGTFIYIALANLVPEINSQHQNSLQSTVLQLTGILTGGGIMLIIALYEHKLKSFFFRNM